MDLQLLLGAAVVLALLGLFFHLMGNRGGTRHRDSDLDLDIDFDLGDGDSDGGGDSD